MAYALDRAVYDASSYHISTATANPNPFSYPLSQPPTYDGPFYPQLDHLTESRHHEWRLPSTMSSTAWPPMPSMPSAATLQAPRPLVSSWQSAGLSGLAPASGQLLATPHHSGLVVPIAIAPTTGLSSSTAGPGVPEAASRTVAAPERRLRKPKLEPSSPLRPFSCQICGKSFSQAANLTAHRRVHTGEKPFLCPVCQRPFSQSSSLVTHKRTHSGERPYTCSHCDKCFTDSSTLTKHLRTHTGQKPYGCPLCLMRFTQSGNLHRHMKTHKST